MNLFDICVVTASNPAQAAMFQTLIERRIDSGLYPREIAFRAFSDPDGGRIGSGGGTIWALKQLLDEFGVHPGERERFFAGHRILMIHAGGESRRLPCYIPEGKLFAPLPLPASSIASPVALDMQLTLFLKYPWRTGELVAASGDVIIDFDPDSVPPERGDICGLAKPASADQGSRHGVFKFDRNRRHVVDFYQKMPAEFLLENAALEGSREVALDMGIVAMSPGATGTLLDFAGTPAASGTIMDSLARGELHIDLYLEICTACLTGIPYEAFSRRVGGQTHLDEPLLRSMYEHFSPLDLSGAVTRRTTFLHLGSLAEYPQSCIELHNKELRPFYAGETAELRPPVSYRIILNNSSDVSIGKSGFYPVYAESCERFSVRSADGRNLFIGVTDRALDCAVPEGVCIDERRIDTRKARVAAVYSIADSFKPAAALNQCIFCGVPLNKWLAARRLAATDLWRSDQPPFDLLDAALFIEQPADAFLEGYWRDGAVDAEWVETWKTARRFSIREINARDNATRRDQRRCDLRAGALRERIIDNRGWFDINAADFVQLFENSDVPSVLADRARRTDDSLLRSYRKRLLAVTGTAAAEPSATDDISMTYVSTFDAGALRLGVKVDQIVWARSPVRLDCAGGWSDTPPYTLRAGGQVTNLAVDLNGQPPIQVFCRPSAERVIRIHSIDLGRTETVHDFETLEEYCSPVSPFALPKAALCLLGLTREAAPANSLERFLDMVGAGLEITLLCAVPKGSGLGTSSILGATILAALHRFFGIVHDEDELFRQVLQMEQMLTTGGGWQDQIGGVVGGVKYIECRPGLRPSPIIHQLDAQLFTDALSRRCFTLFYTGITRLAKNILQDVVDRFNENRPDYLFTVDWVRQLALNARSAIARRDMHELARTINSSWEANNRIHASTTNEQVEALRAGTSGLWRGMKLLGAGGGGYALFVSEDPDQGEALRLRLRESFENERARIVDFSLNPLGLQVTVS